MGCSSGWLDGLHRNSDSGQGLQPRVDVSSARCARGGAQGPVKHVGNSETLPDTVVLHSSMGSVAGQGRLPERGESSWRVLPLCF